MFNSSRPITAKLRYHCQVSLELAPSHFLYQCCRLNECIEMFTRELARRQKLINFIDIDNIILSRYSLFKWRGREQMNRRGREMEWEEKERKEKERGCETGKNTNKRD